MRRHTTLPAVLLVLAVWSCGREKALEVPEGSIALGALAPIQIDVPPASRPADALLDARIPLREGWSALRAEEGVRAFRRALPVRPRTLLTDRAPRGLDVLDATGRPLPHESQEGEGRTRWAFDEQSLTVFLADPSLDPATLVLEDVRAPRREARLNRALSGARGDLEFVRSTFFDSHATRAGLLLPAPGVLRFELDLPPDPRLHFAPCLVPPELLTGSRSDGVTMSVRLRDASGTEVELWSARVEDASCPNVAVDLGRWEGRRVTLTLASDPGADARFDYAFFADPVVVTEDPEPRRVVMLFVDTLRADHLGYAGYERDTSPRVDVLASHSLVFENARAPAPWTLPSARALLTGQHPDRFAVSTTLPEPLRRQGWATAFFGGNAFVSANYGLDRGWGLHRADQGVSATEMVDRGLAWLEDQKGRDALLMLHFMDAHLPYEEPDEYRRLFAGDAPASLGETFDRWKVNALGPLAPEKREYVVGRYDNNLRYVDQQIGRLLEALDDEAIVVLFSDHGEEFWEHGGFEHGHALYDELLRVPLLVRAPGVDAGRVGAAVSLLDVMPTVLDLVDVPAPAMRGRSLLALAGASRKDAARFGERPFAFGWPLYGGLRWGALKGESKYLTHVGVEELYELGEDPGETINLLEGEGWGGGATGRALLAEALDREVRLAFLALAQSRAPSSSQSIDLRLQVPGGFETVWSHEGYLQPPTARVESAIDQGVAYVRWQGWFRSGHPVIVLPKGEFEKAGAGLELSARRAGRVGALPVERVPDLIRGRVRRALSITEFPDGMRVLVSPVVTPMPLDPFEEGVRYDAESESALRSLGYTGGGNP